MNLLYVGKFMFSKKEDKTYGLPSCADSFFIKYLNVFDNVKVLGEEIKSFLDKSSLMQISDERITVEILPANTSPKDFRNDKKIKKILREEISKAEAVLIKPACRKGMMAIKIAEKLHKPYMIEMTGDIHNALLQNPSFVHRMYAPVLYRQIKNAIKNCKYGIYVSESYLQGKYPIAGKMCGCSDVVLEKSEDVVLEKRLEKIENSDSKNLIDLCLVGFYQGNGKGVDTAIRAMSRLPENYHFTVLGNGTEENRKKWIEYGEKFGVYNRIHFDEPLSSAKEVLCWLDNFDIFVLPTRSEGLCRCIVEAISRGMPCFATDICTMPELLPKECLFPLDDDEKLANLVKKYVSDKELMKNVARINFENAKKYDFEILKERRDNFLREFKEYCENFNKES